MQERITVAKVNKLYHLLDQSFHQAVIKYGSPETWGLQYGISELPSEDADESEKTITQVSDMKKFNEYLLSGLKKEDVSEILPLLDTNYLNNPKYEAKNPDGFKLQPLYRLADGTIIFHGWINKECTGIKDANNLYLKNTCADFRIDINGEKKPNIIGIDQFQFRVTKRGIIPVGIPEDPSRPIEKYCNPKETLTYNGYSCGAWVLYKKEMPWLYGKQVSWQE